ncbi:hypothetical protein M422DRAFT_274720 [Sphaerobolus stellatus SS14]|uniref:Uncharacterized protein n=1 Tax=Sphaerobolus stellatus (strain SS14) TaxID=990650 RepID=A0A0C9U5W8_SPHS4|nr:hypothetical protein M422DRAFT_274710 [Sphaerobolus stellatus SS14]KIJ24492.1 hypothetical protein M422DRAFT_274720 [Sphaerobolus stellatus SS14]
MAGIVIAVSTIAPASLGVGTVVVNGGITALPVATLNRISLFTSTGSNTHWIKSCSVAWAVNALGENVSFVEPSDPESNTCMIPKPQGISTLNRAIWFTDVAVIKPSCSWIMSNLSGDIPDVDTVVKNPQHYKLE